MKVEELLLTHTERQAIWLASENKPGNDLCRAQVEKMKRKGAVMLAEDQSKPANPWTDVYIVTVEDEENRYRLVARQTEWERGQKSMIKAGFRRVEEIE